jgi:hypothetical protein
MRYFLLLLFCFGFSKADPIEDAIALTDKAFLALKSSLEGAMADGDVSKAIEFCKNAAPSITNQFEVRRISEKYRNPLNAPTEKELLVLGALKDKPISVVDGKLVHVYRPIYIKQDVCLKCHGELSEDLKTKIQSLYPDDRATGYKVGDLRGAWKVTYKQ